MMKHATSNTITPPAEGWSCDENGKMTIDYFDGPPYPEIFEDLEESQEDDSDCSIDFDLTSSGEESDW